MPRTPAIALTRHAPKDPDRDPRVAGLVCHQPQQPGVIHRIEKSLDIGVHHPVLLRTIHPDRERIQRIVLTR